MCIGGEKWAYPVPAKVILQVSPDSVMLFSQPICVHRRRETAHPEKQPTLTLRSMQNATLTANIDQVFLKVSPDMAMLFSQPLLVHRREAAHPVPPMKSVTAKVILKVSSHTTMLFYQPVCV